VANKPLRLGSILLERGVITQENLDYVLEKQQESGKKVGEILIDEKIISYVDLAETLSQQLDCPLADLKHYEFDEELVKLIPESIARKFQIILLDEQTDYYVVGMADPLDIDAQDVVNQLLDKPSQVEIVTKPDLLKYLDQLYRRTSDISKFAKVIEEDVSSRASISELGDAATEEDAPVIRLLSSIFQDAVQVRASDIHIEPGEHSVRIRYRVDGLLQEHVVQENRIMPMITSRLKLMAKLNISETRTPQDGRFFITVRKNKIDIRLSTLPTQYGESIVMRLLDQSSGLLRLNNIGMKGKVLEDFKKMLHLPYGLILVTGPTGSGKSTTLYGGLNELNSVEKKICTVEDPVEYRIERINQTHINDKVGLSFATALRSILRQDPDIIMVGEIRDKETAEIAIRAAMTGHLVLSTLHTNDAPSSAVRLIDMGVPSYLVSTTLRCVLAQRLIRKLCDACKETYKPDDIEKEYLRNWTKDKSTHDADYFKAIGCSKCNHSGYQGRNGIFELLTINQSISYALQDKSTLLFTKTAENALKGKMLIDQALSMAKSGETSIEEIIRTIGLGRYSP
jgi:MSHA biogenesis protein MshE